MDGWRTDGWMDGSFSHPEPVCPSSELEMCFYPPACGQKLTGRFDLDHLCSEVICLLLLVFVILGGFLASGQARPPPGG